MILLFDTSTPTGLLVLGKQGRVLSSATWVVVSASRLQPFPHPPSIAGSPVSVTEKSHSQKLQPQIELALRQAGITLSQLTHIAVGIGPGSFTGLRVALATAKGLGVALGIPMVAIPSLALFAAGCVTDADTIISTTDAFRNEIYVATYQRELSPAETKSMTPSHAIEQIQKIHGPLTLIGSGYLRYKAQFDEALQGRQVSPTSELHFPGMLALAERYIRQGDLSNPASLQPYYVRDAEAVEKRRK